MFTVPGKGLFITSFHATTWAYFVFFMIIGSYIRTEVFIHIEDLHLVDTEGMHLNANWGGPSIVVYIFAI